MSEKLVSQRQELRGVGVSSGIGFGHARVMQTSSLQDRKSTRLNSSHSRRSRMPSSA